MCLAKNQNWLDSQADVSDQEIADLPIAKQEFDDAKINLSNFSSMIAASVTRADMYELKQLLKMIERLRKLVARMTLDNVLKKEARLYIQVDIMNKEIAESTVKVQQLLKRLYRNRASNYELSIRRR